MEEEKLIRFHEKSIPSYINKVKNRRLTAESASRDFSEQLKRLKNRQKAQELLNRLNQSLRNSRSTIPGKAKETALSESEPIVIIDGPSSISSNQSITLSAETDNLLQDEGYNWEIQGNIPGVFHSPGELAEDGSSRTYNIETNSECESGTLYVVASGTISSEIGATTIQVIGRKKNEREQLENSEQAGSEQENTAPEKNGNAVEERKKSVLRDWLSKEGRKKITDSIKQKFSKEALAALWKALLPYLPWIILIIVVLVAGIAIFAALTREASSGKAGSTLHQEVDVASDSGLLEKVILATGDKNTKADLNSKVFPDIQKQLLALKENADPKTQEKITDTSAKIDQYTKNNDPALGKEIVKNVKEILASLDQQVPAIKVSTRSPLDSITDYNFNLHYGTPLNKEMPSNGSGHATYTYYGEGKADAVDLYTNKDSKIFPAFSGKIADYSDDGTGHKKIVIKNGSYQILYANFNPIKDLGIGQSVSTESAIGKVAEIDGQNQLHVELTYEGKPITTTGLDKINYKDNNKPWGQYLWDHMKKVLNLQ